MSRWFVIVAVLFVLVSGGFTLAVAQDATPETNTAGTPCAVASPMMGTPEAMASPMAMAEATPVAGCVTPTS